MADNPFVELGPPPEDPQGQLEWLEKMILALEKARDARLKPLKKRLRTLMVDFERNHKLGKAPEEIGEHFHRKLRDLKIETFTVLLRLIQQIDAGVKVQLAKEGPEASADPEALDYLRQIAEFAIKLRRLLRAMKNNDKEAEAAVQAEFASAKGP